MFELQNPFVSQVIFQQVCTLGEKKEHERTQNSCNLTRTIPGQTQPPLALGFLHPMGGQTGDGATNGFCESKPMESMMDLDVKHRAAIPSARLSERKNNLYSQLALATAM